jgi:predicted house-cleaning noncanonical NTP pyrophosphatase (MazG superfamily)
MTTAPKLVRDRIPDIIRASGQHPVTRIADGTEMGPLLRAKLLEEAAEAAAASPADLPGELADLTEVMAAIAAHAGISRDAVEQARARKRAERGAFAGRVVWLGNEDARPPTPQSVSATLRKAGFTRAVTGPPGLACSGYAVLPCSPGDVVVRVTWQVDPAEPEAAPGERNAALGMYAGAIRAAGWQAGLTASGPQMVLVTAPSPEGKDQQ